MSKSKNGELPLFDEVEEAEGDGLPDGWVWSDLKSVCRKITDGTHHSPSKEVQTAEGEYKYVTAKNIKEHGIILDKITYLPEEVHRPIYERCNPEQGDVLYIKDGVTTGVATVNQLDEEFSMLSSVALLKPIREVISPRFMKWYLNSPTGFKAMTSKMGGTAIKRLTLRKINEGKIPIAPLDEQKRIVSKIEELFSDLDAGVSALERARANLRRYRASVLKSAVEGRVALREPGRRTGLRPPRPHPPRAPPALGATTTRHLRIQRQETTQKLAKQIQRTRRPRHRQPPPTPQRLVLGYAFTSWRS